VKSAAGETHSTPEYWKGLRYGVAAMLNLILVFTMANVYLLAIRVTKQHRAAPLTSCMADDTVTL
jgi:hypothetical protein